MDFDYEEAVLACARGERYALKAIYLRDSQWLFTVALRIVRRRELAEEVLQDAFIKIWTRASTYSPTGGSARGWVYSIVRNQALNAVRTDKDSPVEAVTEQEGDVNEAPILNSELLQDVDVQAMHICLTHLDDTKRQAIMLAFVSGLSHGEVAKEMNAPLGSVKAWIRRGLIKLKECLK